MNGIVYWIAVIVVLGLFMLIVYGLCNLIARNISKEDPASYADEVQLAKEVCKEIRRVSQL
jgi:hypothetical protein